ncbi:MAG: AraC family transcriptional regulator [Candidatus Avispirillum sp.]
MTATVKLDEISRALGKEPLCGSLDKEVCGCYAGDLLSWVMSHASYGDVWITIMSNINVAAVASLTECACVIMAEGVEPDADTLKAAGEKDITLFSDQRSVYELCCLVGKVLCNNE